MTVYTTLPTDDENLEVTVIDDPDLVTLNINPAQVTGSGGTTGTVERVDTGTGLTGGPITTTGTVSIDETSDISFNSVTSDFFGVQHFTAKARETITAGQPVYISGHSGNTPEVMIADFDDPTKMPAFGIASADIANNNNGSISTYGDLKNIDTTGTTEGETWAVGDELYVNNSKLTNTRPTGSSEAVQKIAKIIRVHANTGQMFLMGAGRTNDIPNLTTGNVFIGNGSGYDKRTLTSADVTNSAGYITASSTDTLTNKSGSNSQWTNDAGYTTNTGTVTPSSTDTFTNKSGSNSQWTNDEAYLKANALTPYYTSTQVDALPVSTFSNDAGYSTTTGTVTPSSTDTFTNKSGNISQWTNDAGYLTSETDNQTLSFANPNLSISNGNSVDLSALNTTTLAWSAITSTPTTISGYGITDAFDGDYNSLTNQPTIPTQTVINNNADNSIITGSATADNLNGEADFTWDGTNAVIDGTASNLTTPVLSLVTDNSSWNAAQLMCTDSNGKVFSQVGQLNTAASAYVWNITLDPDNTHGRTGVTNYPGDYYVDFRKEYDDQSAIKITQNIFGANGGYIMRVKDDFNGNSPRYDFKPMIVQAEEFRVEARDGVRSTDLALTVDIDKAKFEVPIGHAQLSADPSSPENGWTYYNTTTDKLRLYAAGAWVDLN